MVWAATRAQLARTNSRSAGLKGQGLEVCPSKCRPPPTLTPPRSSSSAAWCGVVGETAEGPAWVSVPGEIRSQDGEPLTHSLSLAMVSTAPASWAPREGGRQGWGSGPCPPSGSLWSRWGDRTGSQSRPAWVPEMRGSGVAKFCILLTALRPSLTFTEGDLQYALGPHCEHRDHLCLVCG